MHSHSLKPKHRFKINNNLLYIFWYPGHELTFTSSSNFHLTLNLEEVGMPSVQYYLIVIDFQLIAFFSILSWNKVQSLDTWFKQRGHDPQDCLGTHPSKENQWLQKTHLFTEMPILFCKPSIAKVFLPRPHAPVPDCWTHRTITKAASVLAHELKMEGCNLNVLAL
jgi:hypothetical protein